MGQKNCNKFGPWADQFKSFDKKGGNFYQVQENKSVSVAHWWTRGHQLQGERKAGRHQRLLPHHWSQGWGIDTRKNRQPGPFLTVLKIAILIFISERRLCWRILEMPRAKITKEREELRAAVLKKALTELDPTARPVWSWKQRDKLSSAFLLNTPGAHSSLSTPIFREAVAALLCALSGFCICNAKMLFNKKQVKTIPILLTIPWQLCHAPSNLGIASPCDCLWITQRQIVTQSSSWLWCSAIQKLGPML